MLRGKGAYIWHILSCEGGNISKIVAEAYRAGLSHVLVKIADGTHAYNGDDAIRLTDALHEAGIAVWGWHYCYGTTPGLEASTAVMRINETGVDGYVIDAEGEYKGRGLAAQSFCRQLREMLGPDFPIALSSYRYPSLHREFPWREFLEHVDYNMPQVYWLFANNPGEQLRRCVSEFQTMTPFRPIIPTGAAWKQGSWSVSPAEIVEFLDTARELGLSGANVWDWQHARRDLPQTWEALAEYAWEPVAEQPKPEPKPVPTHAGPIEVLLRQNVNLRAAPSTSAAIIGLLPKGSVETVIGLEGQTVWVKVMRTESHPDGWAAFRWNGSHFMEIV